MQQRWVGHLHCLPLTEQASKRFVALKAGFHQKTLFNW